MQRRIFLDSLKSIRIIRQGKILNSIGSSFTNNKKVVRAALLSTAFVVPAAYVTVKHIDMYPQNDPKNRAKMRNKMLGFFAGVGVSVALAHQKFKASDSKNLKEAAKIIGVLAAPFVGLGAAKLLNKEN